MCLGTCISMVSVMICIRSGFEHRRRWPKANYTRYALNNIELISDQFSVELVYIFSYMNYK